MSTDMQLRTDYREWMKETLKERVDNNPSYSLRAFARDLKLSPASVSLILKGRKGLSKPSAERVAKSMGLTPPEQEYFKALVLTRHGRTEAARQMAQAKLSHLSLNKEKHVLEIDRFQVMAQWYHFGILQLTHLKRFRSEIPWMARQLDIPEADAREAVARLKRLGLLKTDENGRLVTTKDILLSKHGIPSEALRKFHRQMIEKAVKAIQDYPVEKRMILSTQIPMRADMYEKISTRLYELQSEFIQKYSASEKDGDLVYGFNFQLYPLSRETD